MVFKGSLCHLLCHTSISWKTWPVSLRTEELQLALKWLTFLRKKIVISFLAVHQAARPWRWWVVSSADLLLFSHLHTKSLACEARVCAKVLRECVRARLALASWVLSTTACECSDRHLWISLRFWMLFVLQCSATPRYEGACWMKVGRACCWDSQAKLLGHFEWDSLSE